MVDPLTLADVREQLLSNQELAEQRRRDLRCSLKRFARLLNRDLIDIPADPVVLREEFANLHASQAGLSAKRLVAIKGHVTRSLELCGVPIFRRKRAGFSPRWQALHDALPTLRLKASLSSFMRYCDGKGLAPDEVTDETGDAFKAALDNQSVHTSPKRLHHDSCRYWNIAAETVPGWPSTRLKVISYRYDPDVLPWESFPRSLCDDTENYLAWFRLNGRIRSRPPTFIRSPFTCARHRDELRALASALVKSGIDANQLRLLSDIIAVDAIKRAMRFRLKQHNGIPTTYDRFIVSSAIQAARDWAGVDDDTLKELREVLHRLGPQRLGVSPKSRAALRQFISDDNQRLIFNLPDKIMREVTQNDSGTRIAAVTAQKAVAIELLLAAPMRIGNLVALRTDRHLHRRDGPAGPIYITLPAEEVRGGQETTFVLSRHATDITQLYLERFHPRLAGVDCPWLFPGETGAHKHVNLLSTQIRRTVFDYTGLRLTPSQFRHLAAKLLIDSEPGAYELVRLLLGHKRLHTSLWTYRSIKMAEGMDRYDRILNKLDSSHDDPNPDAREGV